MSLACIAATILSCYPVMESFKEPRTRLPDKVASLEFIEPPPAFEHANFNNRFELVDDPNPDRWGDAGIQMAIFSPDDPLPMTTIIPEERPSNKKRQTRERKRYEPSQKQRRTEPKPRREKIVLQTVSLPGVKTAAAYPTQSWFSGLFTDRDPPALKALEKTNVNVNSQGYSEVVRAAKKHGVPVNLALKVAKKESGGVCNATSKANARGVMQVMAKTARKHGVNDPKQLYNCRTGAEAGVKELKHLLKVANGDIKQTLIGYNCGEGCMFGRRKKLPGETKDYVAKITSASY